MSCRKGRICLNLRPSMSCPMNTIGPVDEISRRMARPSVVLPDPDSPTTPSVSPCRNSMLTPSTALMCPTTLRNTPRLTGNHTFSRSEEHTSELQSLRHLVCRLLLEKKKKYHIQTMKT